jgi:hypothetical protein
MNSWATRQRVVGELKGLGMSVSLTTVRKGFGSTSSGQKQGARSSPIAKERPSADCALARENPMGYQRKVGELKGDVSDTTVKKILREEQLGPVAQRAILA